MRLPYIRFYFRDYLGDTGHLSSQQDGIYIRLIANYCTAGCPLPADLPTLYRLARAIEPSEQTDVKYVLGQFFKLDGNVYRHKRVDAELAWSATKSLRGKKAADARWDNEAPLSPTPPEPQTQAHANADADADADAESQAYANQNQKADANPQPNRAEKTSAVSGQAGASQPRGVAPHPIGASPQTPSNQCKIPLTLDEEIEHLEILNSYMQANGPALTPKGHTPAICFTDANGNMVVKTTPPTPDELQQIVAQIKAGNPKAFGFGFVTPRADN